MFVATHVFFTGDKKDLNGILSEFKSLLAFFPPFSGSDDVIEILSCYLNNGYAES